MADTDKAAGPHTGFDRQTSVLVVVYIALILLTVLFAGFKGYRGRNPFQQISSLLIVVAITMMLCQFILSRYILLFSRNVKLGRIISFHKTMGLLLTAVILTHPLLSLGPRFWLLYLSDIVGGTYLIITSSVLSIGVIAYVLFIVSTAGCLLRKYLPIEHRTWRLAHGTGWAIIITLSVYHALRVGRHSNVLLASLWAGLLIVCLALMGYTYLYPKRPK